MSGSAEYSDDAQTPDVDEDASDVTMHDVELEHEGETVSLSVPEDEYILDAAEEEGLDLPYSCRQGQCTSCVGKVVSGDVDQGEGAALDPMQKDDGYALLCVAYPTADCSVETDAQSDLFDMDIF